jgi:hypothetical protein
MAQMPFELPDDLELKEALYYIWVNFLTLYNQGIVFGGGAGEGHIAGLGGTEVVWDGVTTEQAVAHNLDVVPQGYIALNVSADEYPQGRPTASEVTGQSTDWTTTNIYVVSSIANKALIFVVK